MKAIRWLERRARTAGVVAIVAILAASPRGVGAAERAPGAAVTLEVASDDLGARRLLGDWWATDDSSRVMRVTTCGRGVLVLTGAPAWQAVGFWSGTDFAGTIRALDEGGRGVRGLATGRLTARLRDERTLEVEADWPAAGSFAATWRRAPGTLPRDTRGGPPPEPAPGDPEPGEYLHVDELPVVIEKHAPAYPPEARRAGVEGTVMVQALVGRDGRVRDVRVVTSVPELDAAATASIRKWRFKPALAGGRPVPLWVAVPVTFSLR